jgi:mitochondrial fission protein ELM1
MLIIWVLTDGKRGHENQSLGLAKALARKTSTQLETIRVNDGLGWLMNWLLGKFPPGQNCPKPDLILAAGHTTHFPLLAARRAFGGKAVALMKPSLPLMFFDRVVVPRHDGLKPDGNHLTTEGPINRVQPNKSAARTVSLFLIGGPSPHFQWDSAKIIRQILAIASQDPGRRWTLTTSRRTPTDFLSQLTRSSPENLTVVPHEQTGADWLPVRLSSAQVVWVTPDSVSMVYEALTAEAGVGLFDLPSRQTRVARSILSLLEQKLVIGFDQWQQQPCLPRPAPHFNEADRIADEILRSL